MRSVPRDQEGARPRAGQPASVREAAPWHALPAADVLARLGSGPDGLAEAEARGRLARHGPNRLPAARPRGPLRRLLAQLDSLLIYVLLASAAVTLLLGHAVDAAVILGVVVLNALVGFAQEGRAERALDAVRGMLGPEASVLRDGRRRTVPAEDLVPGDLVLLEPGDRVPADLRLVRARGLRVEEAALTGESVAVEKAAEPVAADAPLGDRAPLAFSGTLVAAGQGAGVAVATGAATEIGRVGTLLGSVRALATPLTRRMDEFARRLTGAILAGSAVVFAVAVLARGLPGRGGVHGRGRHRGGGHPRGPAGGADRGARDRGPAHGGAPRHRAPPARGRDAGLGDRDLLGQDRHPDPQRDDRPRRRHRRRLLRR